MNIVIINGHITQAPKLQNDSNKVRTFLHVAVPRRLSSTDEPTELSVTAFGPLARQCVNGLVVGQEVEIQGRLSTHTLRLESGKDIQTSYVVAKNVDFGKRPKSHDEGGPPPHPKTRRT